MLKIMLKPVILGATCLLLAIAFQFLVTPTRADDDNKVAQNITAPKPCQTCHEAVPADYEYSYHYCGGDLSWSAEAGPCPQSAAVQWHLRVKEAL